MPHLGAPELLILLIIGVVFFGAGKIPQLGSSLGKGIKNFKSAMEGGEDDDEDEEIDVTPKKKKKSDADPALASSNTKEEEEAAEPAKAVQPK